MATKEELRVQVELQLGNRHRVCWVASGVKVGNRITLKGSETPDEVWEVLSVSQPRAAGDINRGWENDI